MPADKSNLTVVNALDSRRLAGAVTLLLNLFSATLVAAHDLPIGTVKITNQVIVQADVTLIQYDVGFHPTTLIMILKELGHLKTSSDYQDNLKIFRKWIKKRIQKTVMMTMDKKVVLASKITVEPMEIAKHIQTRLTLSYPTARKTRVAFDISDSSFVGLTRLYGSGFKTKGPIALMESSTKAIPIRSPTSTKPPQDSQPFTIVGEIKLLQPLKSIN